jgi:small subunit ribosomal protein S6e
LTDEHKPRSRGPKRASKIRKLYNLSKEDDVKAAAKLHGKTVERNGKTYVKTVKIQRLVTPTTLQRKRRRIAIKKARIDRARLLLSTALSDTYMPACARTCLRHSMPVGAAKI